MGTACGMTYERLLKQARDPADLATLALAGVIAGRPGIPITGIPIIGIGAADYARLLERYFPGVASIPDGNDIAGSTRAEEVLDILQLLLESRSVDGEEATWVAHAVATACLGGNHLWQDLQLPNRQALSDLLATYFRPLFARNTGNMKWKKFFYKQLCDRAEINLCKAPSCGVCSDYAQCFGPEDASPKAVETEPSARAQPERPFPA